MKLRVPSFSFALIALALFACSSKSTPPSADTSGDGGAPSTIPQGPTTWTMDETVPGSSEEFKCEYVQMPPSAGYITGGQHEFTPGSHHLLIYTTNLTSIPASATGAQDCYEGTGSYMADIRGVVYGSAVPTGEIQMPSGIGIPYAAGAVMLFQTHYLNPNAQPLAAHAEVYLSTVASGVTTNADVLFFYDPYIDVPVGAHATANMRCPINKDVTLLAISSHQHARGAGYQAYLDPPSGPAATTPFYTSTNWASPVLESNQSMKIAGGSFIRFTCDYDNTQGTAEYFQGVSAATNEMCMFIALYYPAMTEADDNCYNGDEVGTGTVGCTDTLTCLAACPVDNDPTDPNFGYDTCTQKCMVAACPGTMTPAGGPLQAAGDCIEQNCTAACGGDGGVSGSACTSCVAANCLTEYEACQNAPCQVP